MADDHHGLILPGDRQEPAKPDKPYFPLHTGQSAKLSVSLPGAVEIVAEDSIVVLDAGDWIILEIATWAKVVGDLARVTAELQEKTLSKRAVRIQRRKDRRN